MKKNIVKTIGATAVLLGGLMQVAQAHTIVSALGAPASSTDVWSLTCPKGVAKVQGYVRETRVVGDATRISLSIVHATKPFRALNTVAPNAAANSPIINVVAGTGQYLVLVTRSLPGINSKDIETYNGTIHCLAANNVEIGSEPVLVQNQ